MTFRTCGSVTHRPIASYQEIFWSTPVEDKLATPGIYEPDMFHRIFVPVDF